MGGVNVTVCSVSPNPHSDIYQPQGYRHVQVREPPLRFFLAKEFQRFLLSQPRDTIFHFHSVFIPWFLPAMRLLRRHGYQRIILTPHGQYTDAAMSHSLKKRVFFHLFDSKVVSLASAVHIIGHTEENDHITRNARRWQLIPNGCTPQPPRKGTGWQLVFSYLGRMDATQKGLDTLIQAFAFHRQQGGHGTLRLAGDGADLAALQKLVRQLGVANEVEFTGKLFGEQKQQFFDASAFFLHPSRWDVVPTACMEAAASGVPLIVSRATCLDTYTERYNAGLVTTDDGRPVLALDSIGGLPVIVLDSGNIGHVSFDGNDATALKTFTDLMMMARARAVYRIDAPELYAWSGFARVSASIGGVGFLTEKV